MSAWKLTVTDIRQGLVTAVDVTAVRKCGRTEHLTAYQFPAGWRMARNTAPKGVVRDAMRLVREVWE